MAASDCRKCYAQRENRRSQTSDLRKAHAWQHKAMISNLSPAETIRLATKIDDLRLQICENVMPVTKHCRSETSDLRKRRAQPQKATISSRRPAKTPRLSRKIDNLRPQICDNRRSQAAGLQKRRAWRPKSTISGRGSAKTPRLAPEIDDLWPPVSKKLFGIFFRNGNLNLRALAGKPKT